MVPLAQSLAVPVRDRFYCCLLTDIVASGAGCSSTATKTYLMQGDVAVGDAFINLGSFWAYSRSICITRRLLKLYPQMLVC